MYRLQEYTPVDIRGDEEMTSLHIVAFKGHFQITKYLFEQGADVNVRKINGWTPLCSAAQEGHLDIIIFLFRQGAEVNARNNDDATPLHWAAMRGHQQIAQFLIQQEAEMNVLSHIAETPLLVAIANSNFDVAKSLIDHGANVHAAYKLDSTILHCTTTYGRLDVARSLVQQGVELDVKDNNNETALHCAATNGHLDMVAFLIEQGAEINAKKKDGWAPVHQAAYFGHFDVLSFLFKQGVEVNLRNGFGDTCLHAAIAQCHVDVAKFLVTHGADVNVRNDINQTPLHNGAFFGQLEAVKFLVKLNDAVLEAGHPIDKPAKMTTDLDTPDIFWRTPIHIAIDSGHAEVAGFLAEHGADVFCLDGYGRTALDWACASPANFQQFDKYWPRYVPTPEALRVEALHRSIHRLSRRLLDKKLPRTSPGFYELGHCLVFLGRVEDACFCFQQQIFMFDGDGRPVHDASCDLCDMSNLTGTRFVCKICPSIDLCAACMEEYPGKDKMPLCQNHEFFPVSQVSPSEDKPEGPELIGEKVQEWLRHLIAHYGKSEMQVANGTLLEAR